MKKIFFVLFLLVSVFSASFATEVHEKTLDEIVGDLKIENTLVKKVPEINVYSIYNPSYKDIRVIVYYKPDYTIDSGDLEAIYQSYISEWIKDESHRYYNYKTVNRIAFYKKNFLNSRYNTYEVYAILKK